MDLKELDRIKVNFIIGPGRSGTTLLVFIFNQHKNCIATPEVVHFIYFYNKYKDVKVVSQALIDDYKAYLATIFNSRKRILFSADDSDFLDILKVGQEITYSQLTKLVYLALYNEKKDVATIHCIIDKNPYYTFNTDKVVHIFPEAKFLAMVRDYRAYIYSNISSQNPVVAKRSLSFYAIAWSRYMKKLQHLLSVDPDRMKIIKYEELTVNQEKVLKETAAFFELDYSTEMIEFHKNVPVYLQENMNKRPSLPGENHEHMMTRIKALASPINPSRVEEWKKGLNEGQKKEAETLASFYGNKFGYEDVTRRGFFTGLGYRIKSIPAYIRVSLFVWINSPYVYYYLNVESKIKRERKYLQKNRHLCEEGKQQK